VLKLTPETPDRDRGRGARSTRERLSDAALEHPQLDVPFVDALHEAYVHALRKARVPFEHGTQYTDRRAFHRVHGNHDVRVAHRPTAELDTLVGQLQVIAIAALGRDEGQRLGIEARLAEVDADTLGRDHLRERGTCRADERQLGTQARRKEARKAAHAVAAL